MSRAPTVLSPTSSIHRGWWATKDLRRVFQISHTRVYEWLSLGLPHVQLTGSNGRRLYHPEAVERWVRETFGLGAWPAECTTRAPSEKAKKGGRAR